MSIEQDKRDKFDATREALSTSAGSSDDGNEKKVDPLDLNTTFFPENSGTNGDRNEGETIPDLNTTFFTENSPQIDQEQARIEYKDLGTEHGFAEPLDVQGIESKEDFDQLMRDNPEMAEEINNLKDGEELVVEIENVREVEQAAREQAERSSDRKY